jgi:hypothetical protein
MHRLIVGGVLLDGILGLVMYVLGKAETQTSIFANVSLTVTTYAESPDTRANNPCP